MKPNIPLNFVEFLKKNYIDAEKFSQSEPEYWLNLQNEYNQLGMVSFRQRKKFVINSWRKKYPY